MGFFSRIKKLWGADGEPRDEAISPQAPEQAPEQAPTQIPVATPTIPKIEEEPEAQTPHADTPPPCPRPNRSMRPSPPQERTRQA